MAPQPTDEVVDKAMRTTTKLLNVDGVVIGNEALYNKWKLLHNALMEADTANSFSKLREINKQVSWVIHEVDGFATTLPEDWMGHGTKRTKPGQDPSGPCPKRPRGAGIPEPTPRPLNKQITLSQALGTPDIAPATVARPPLAKLGKKKQRLKPSDPRKEATNLHKFFERRNLEP